MKSYPDVDAYLADARSWRAEMEALRPILLNSGLEEAIKWGKPCYMRGGANICILQPMKAFLSLLFFKGALLADPDRLLERQGPNSTAGFRMPFTSVEEIEAHTAAIRGFIDEAIRLEKSGAPIPQDKKVEPLPPAELLTRMDEDPAFKTAFKALTPGRRRAYILHFSAAKQSATRSARIEKCAPDILAGKGLNDR